MDKWTQTAVREAEEEEDERWLEELDWGAAQTTNRMPAIWRELGSPEEEMEEIE